MDALARSAGTSDEHRLLVLIQQVYHKRVSQRIQRLYVYFMETLFLLVVELSQTGAPVHKRGYFGLHIEVEALHIIVVGPHHILY